MSNGPGQGDNYLTGTIHTINIFVNNAAHKDDSKGCEKVPKRHQERFFDPANITSGTQRNTGLSSEELIKSFNLEKKKIEEELKRCTPENYESWFEPQTLEQLKTIEAFDGKNKPSTIWKQVEVGKLVAKYRKINDQMRPEKSRNAPNKASDESLCPKSKKRKLDVSDSKIPPILARSNILAVASLRYKPELLELAQKALAPIVGMKQDEEIMKFLANNSLPGKTDSVSYSFRRMCRNMADYYYLGDITASWARDWLIQAILDYHPGENDRREI